LIVDEASLPPELIVTARTADGIPMAIMHRAWPMFGVQFHPESVLTQQGRGLLANFLDIARLRHSAGATDDWIADAVLPESDAEPPLVPW